MLFFLALVASARFAYAQSDDRYSIMRPEPGARAPLPLHMAQSWNLIGFDTTRYDPIEDAPEEE